MGGPVLTTTIIYLTVRYRVFRLIMEGSKHEADKWYEFYASIVPVSPFSGLPPNIGLVPGTYYGDTHSLTRTHAHE